MSAAREDLLWGFVFFTSIFSFAKLDTPCRNEIYCKGEMYKILQRYSNEDLVNKKLLVEPEVALLMFKNLTQNFKIDSSGGSEVTDESDIADKLSDFLGEYFREEEDEVDYEVWRLPDKFVKNISKTLNDRNLATFVNYLTKLLPELALKGTNETLANRNLYSTRSLTGFIRRHKEAKEAFYWETYWVVNGFLLFEMNRTVEVILNNLISMVAEFGFVPKGNRVYYSQRSNPPFLTLMAYNYFIKSKNYNWLKRNIRYLDAELMFWIDNRSILIAKDGRNHVAFRYTVGCTSPRPEVFKKDEMLAEEVTDKEKFYKEIHSASESGWDFSSRWLVDDKGNAIRELSRLNVTRVIPVDLNAYLYKNFVNMARLYSVLNDHSRRNFWQEKSQDLQQAIRFLLWDEREGIWYDYDIELKQPRRYYFISNFMPLWANAFPSDMASIYGDYVASYMIKNQLITKHKGGLPDSFTATTESYDYPNSHSHLVVMVIQGLRNTHSKEASRIANILLTKWMDAVIACWAETHSLFDTYSVESFGQHVSYDQWTEDYSVTIGAFLDMLDSNIIYTERLLKGRGCVTKECTLFIIAGLAFVFGFKLYRNHAMH